MALDQLPDEIIQHLLYYVSPQDTLNGFQPVSRRCYQLSSEPLLWRYHCTTSFRYWHPEHEFNTLIRRPAGEVNWKHLFQIRNSRNEYISRCFEEIVATKVRRHKNFGRIGELGYDAKDFLLEQCNVDESVDDVLTRRYYGQAVLESLHRSIGIEQWRELADPSSPTPPLERALAAFDMFVLSDESGDIDDICSILDDKTSQFRASEPTLDAMSPRQKALCLNSWLRSQNLTGLQDAERDYRNLRNCLIGQALRHDDHESIPIVSSSIYCAMARRIGLDASCLNFPAHIHAVVTAAPGQTMNGELQSDEAKGPDRMYLDPYGNDDEVPRQHLEQLLRHYGRGFSQDIVLSPSPVLAIVTRTGANINATCAAALENPARATNQLTQLIGGDNMENLTACLYASMWAVLVLTPPSSWAELDFFLSRFARSWPEDAWLVEKYLVPRAPNRMVAYGRHAAQRRDAWKVLRTIQHSDELPSTVFSRSDVANGEVPYKIGQVFCHKRYGYYGVITGWSAQGTRNLARQREQDGTDHQLREETVDNEPVNRLRLGNKTYFTYLPEANRERFVIAEESIEIVDDPAILDQEPPFRYAGKYFKRFDRDTCTFISNNREQYPDD